MLLDISLILIQSWGTDFSARCARPIALLLSSVGQAATPLLVDVRGPHERRLHSKGPSLQRKAIEKRAGKDQVDDSNWASKCFQARPWGAQCRRAWHRNSFRQTTFLVIGSTEGSFPIWIEIDEAGKRRWKAEPISDHQLQTSFSIDLCTLQQRLPFPIGLHSATTKNNGQHESIETALCLHWYNKVN